MQRIDCRFSDKIMIPSNGIIASEPTASTADGVKVKVKFCGTWNNENGRYDDELDDVCLRLWGVPFLTMRSIWISRLGSVSNYWHYIQLVKL